MNLSLLHHKVDIGSKQ